MDDEIEGFCTSEEFNKSPFSELGNLSNESGDSEKSGSKRIRLSPESNLQEQGTLDSSQESSPLGLTLRKTPSFIDLVEKTISKGKQKYQKYRSMGTNLGLNNNICRTKMSDNEKLKASNFPAKLLRIGTWQRMSTYEGDLTAKIYYAKRKIVWEILKRPLKCKIEILWSDIIAIRGMMPHNGEGTLEIELNQPPSFYRETDPQPRKHTLWQQSSDFTGGLAPVWRRHYVQFAPGVLDKHYQMLLQCDERLLALSQQPFPSQESPFFDSNIFGRSDFTFNIYGHGSSFLPRMQYPYQTYSTTVTTSPLVIPPNTTSVMDFPSTMTNYQFLTQNQTVWGGQGGNFPISDNIQVAAPINSVTQFSNPVFAHSSPDYVGDSRIPNPNARVLYDIENHLLGDSQVVRCDETSLLAQVDSMCSFLDPLDASSNNRFAPLDMNPNTQVMQNGIENSISDGYYPQPISWRPQYSNDNLVMQPGVNDSFYPFAFASSTIGSFST
ncbi:uncharacterized protein Fot_50233 [Forsythia ovata]|uniref:TRF2/HOY1 PH-like domain-containing protein n=1 Tax=Forsythia ovata TaxID=205694 RepID=A0ABD1PXL9_9LAMI